MLPPLEALCMMAMEPGILVPCLSPLVRMVGARPPPSIPPPQQSWRGEIDINDGVWDIHLCVYMYMCAKTVETANKEHIHVKKAVTVMLLGIVLRYMYIHVPMKLLQYRTVNDVHCACIYMYNVRVLRVYVHMQTQETNTCTSADNQPYVIHVHMYIH